MGCITQRQSNYYNFIGANRANSVVISDLSGDIPFCSDIMPVPLLFGSPDNYFEISLSWLDVPAASEYKIYRSLNGSSYSLIDTVSDLTYTDSGLDIDTLYYYKIKSSNGVTDSSFSNVVTATTLDTIPAPSGLILSDIILESIQLDWVSNSFGGEDGFQVARSLTEIGGYSTITTTGTGVVTYLDDTPPLDHNTTYYYKIRAEYNGDFSAYTSVENATTLLMPAPSDLILTPTLDSVGASWTSNSGGEEDAFDLEASADGIGSWSVVDTVGSGVTVGEETGLSQSTERYYRVRATEAQGNSPYSDVVMTTTLTLEVPTAVILTPSYGDVTVDWTSNSGGEEDGFDIERSLTGLETWSLVGSVLTGVVTFEDTGLTQSTGYDYRVKATRTSGDSDYSVTAMTTTLTLETPTLLIASLPSKPSQIQIDWTSNSGGNEDGFSLERSLDGIGSWTEIAATATNVVTFTNKNNVLPLTDYYYRVKATRTSGDSAYSNIDSNQIVWVAAMFKYYQFGRLQFGQGAPTLERFRLVDGAGNALVDGNGDNITVLREP